MATNSNRRRIGSGLIPASMLLLCLGCVVSHLCAQPAASTDRHSVSGVVVNVNTGLPVRDAEVTLTRTARRWEDRTLAAATASDDAGRFVFAHVAPGKYALTVNRRGYIASAYQEHPNGSTAIVVAEDHPTPELRFELAPQAVLYGTVTEDTGDPVPHAQISLFRHRNGVESGKIVRASSTVADEQGNYEISSLAPGSYYLTVTATPWYLSQSVAQSTSPLREAAAADRPRSPLDVAYPTHYYPDATDPAFAAPLQIAAGERVPINCVLHAVPSLHITLQVPTSAANRVAPMPQLRQDFFGNSNDVPAATSVVLSNPRDSVNPVTAIEISGIAPGAYQLTLSSSKGEPTRETSLNLVADQAIDTQTATPLAEINGKLKPAPGTKLPPGLFLALISQDSESNVNAHIESDGSFKIPAASPGTYEVVVVASGFPLNASELAATGATVAGRLIRVGNDPITLTATIAESNASLHGIAQSSGKPAPGVFLLLVPASPTAGHEAWRSNQSDSDGSFEFPQILPGKYTLVAIADGWTLDWTRPEVIARYLPGGLPVTVSPQTGELQLKQPVPVQPK